MVYCLAALRKPFEVPLKLLVLAVQPQHPVSDGLMNFGKATNIF